MGRSTRSTRSALLVALALPLLAAAAPDKKATEEKQARELFQEGQKAYDVGEFDRALQLYSDAYKLKPLPGFLFNIAQCHRQKGNFKDASFFFGRFIDNTNPTAPNVELARELLADMQRREAEKEQADQRAQEARRAEEQRQADAPLATTLEPKGVVVLPPPPPPPEPEPPLYKKGWFWAVVGTGVAVAAGGTVAAVMLSRSTSPAPLKPTTLVDIDGR